MSLPRLGFLAVALALLVALPAWAQSYDSYFASYLKGSEGAFTALSNNVDDWLQGQLNAIRTADGAMPSVYLGDLTGANQVPAPIATNTSGIIYVLVGKTSGSWALGVGVVKNFTMSHLHYGGASASGPIVLILAPGSSVAVGPTMYNPPISGGIAATGTFTAADVVIPGKTNATLQDLKDAIAANNIYANVHTTSAPAGLIRAQLEEATLSMS